MVHGDADAAYSAMHEAANALLSPDATPPPAASPDPLDKFFAMKARGWWVHIVLSAVHLLEREKRWGDALHYLELLLGISQEAPSRASSSSCEFVAYLHRPGPSGD